MVGVPEAHAVVSQAVPEVVDVIICFTWIS